MGEKTCYLTTFDNPFNPEKEFDSWLNFDIEHGYYSCAYLDRIAKISPAMSEIEKEREYERAIDEILKYDFRNIYTKIYLENDIDTPQVDESESFDDLINKYFIERGAGGSVKTTPSP